MTFTLLQIHLQKQQYKKSVVDNTVEVYRFGNPCYAKRKGCWGGVVRESSHNNRLNTEGFLVRLLDCEP